MKLRQYLPIKEFGKPFGCSVYGFWLVGPAN